MSYNILATAPFERKLKRLARKYPSLKNDILPVIEQLKESPKLGTALGKNCYKIRLAIASKNTGKSGGGRLITLVQFKNETVYLLDLYDKSEKDSISEQELIALIELIK